MDSRDLDALKQALLSTGFPLESTIENVVRDLLFSGITADFGYSRKGMGGPDREVDLVARRGFFRESLEGQDEGSPRLSVSGTLHVAIECKSRKPGVKWFFSQFGGEEPARDYGPVLRHRGFVSVTTSLDTRLKYEAVGVPDMRGTPICSRALELRPAGLDAKSRNPKHSESTSDSAVTSTENRRPEHQFKYDSDPSSIRNGHSQLQFALPSVIHSVLAPSIDSHKALGVQMLRDSLSFDRNERLGLHVDIFSAYLVTNAELWLLGTGVGLPEVECAKSLGEVATAVSVLELTSPMSDERRDQMRNVFAPHRNWATVDLTVPTVRAFFDWLEPLVSGLELLRPSVFVVRADSLATTLNEHLTKLQPFVKEIGQRAGESVGLRFWA